LPFFSLFAEDHRQKFMILEDEEKTTNPNDYAPSYDSSTVPADV
jgi:hypothetical protein